MSGRRGRDSFSNFDPFAGFGGLGGMGGPQSMISSFFGGRDPFDDPFFTRPFGSPFGSMFESSFFGGNSSPFPGPPQAGFIEQKESQPNKRRGPVIQELDSDDEHAEDGGDMKTKDNSRKHFKLAGEPYVEIPDDASDGVADARNIHQHQHQHQHQLNNEMNHARRPSQSHCYTFQSSTVSYGGANGTYYSKSMAKRAGSDGVVFEELKEADSTTGQANHRISRGIHNKGHTLARKLNSDGRVDTRQMLHNLNQDELDSFEKAWEGSAGRHLTGGRLTLDGGNSEPGSRGQSSRGGWALPSTQLQQNNGNLARGNNATHTQQAGQRAENPGAHMQSTGKRTADRGPHGRKRA